MTQENGSLPLRDPDAPFAVQLEWLANRYNPGYFLGGTIRPELRLASLGWHAKRVAAAFAFVSGVMVLAPLVLLLLAAGLPPDPWSLGFGLLSVLAGLKLWKSASAQPVGPGTSAPDEGGRALRVVATVVLGAVVVAAIGVMAVVGLAVATALAGGNAAIAAAIAVVLAVIAVRRRREHPQT